MDTVLLRRKMDEEEDSTTYRTGLDPNSIPGSITTGTAVDTPMLGATTQQAC